MEKLLSLRDKQGWRLGKWLVAALVLALYLPLVPKLYGHVGTVGLAAGLIPCIFWGIWLGPYPGAFFAFLLGIPHYLLLRDLGEPLLLQGRIELLATHIVMATVTYFLTNGFHLRSRLAIQLAESEAAQARFRGLFERTTDMVFIMSMELHLLDVNDVALQLLGYKREELIGASYRKVIVPEEQDDLTQRLANAASSKVRQHIYERTYITKDGQRIPAEVDSGVFRDGHGRILHYQAIGRDIRQRKAAEIELYHQATHDELTGLYNRTLFAEVLWRAIERSKRSNRKAAVLFTDLDGFKKINDTFGHSMGDLLLKAVARRLREIVRTTDTLARLGGDEFGIILEDLNTRSEAQKVADAVQSTLSQPFIIQSVYPDDETDPDRLLRAADAAMYKLKREKYAAR